MSGARVAPPRSPWQDWLARLPGPASGPPPSCQESLQAGAFPPHASYYFPSAASSVLHPGPPPRLSSVPSSSCPLPDTPFGNQPKAPAGLPGFQRHPFIRDVAFDPGGVEPSRFNDGLHAAFNVENRLSLRDITYFVAQSHTPHDRCLRFGPHVTMTPARLAPSLPATALAGRDLHPQDIAGFAQRTRCNLHNRQLSGKLFDAPSGPRHVSYELVTASLPGSLL